VNPSRVAPSLTAPEGWLSTSQAAPSEVLKVSAATPEHDCKDRASTLRAALSEVPEVSAATLKHDCKVCASTSRAAPSVVPAESAVLGFCGNYGNRTRGPWKTHRAKKCRCGRRTLGPYKSHWATRSYGNRTQGPMKSLWAQKCEGRRAREPVTGPSGPPSIPASSPCPRHGWNGGQTFNNDGQDATWSNPLPDVLALRPSACDLVPAQPAYVSDSACLSGLAARASKRASVQPALASDAACPAQSGHVNESSLTGAPLPLEIVQEATALEATVPQAGKPSVECVPRRVAFGLSSSPLVAVGFRPHSAVQTPLVLGTVALGSSSPPSVALGFSPDSTVQPPLVLGLGTVSDSVFSIMLPQAAEPMHNVNPSRVAPSLTALEGWLSTSRAAPSVEVSAATPEYDCKVRASTLRAAPSEVPEVSAATPKHDCIVCATTSRAAPSVVPAESAATPIAAGVTTAAHPHTQVRAPCCAKVAGETCWAPVVLAFQSSGVGKCTHAMWHSLGSMMHNALRGIRVGEASHPGPVYPPHAVCSHDPHSAVRIGEASNPGPKNNGGALNGLLQGLDLKAMLLPLITEMIQQAIAEILGGTVQQMGPRPQIDAAQTPGKPKGAKGADRVKGGGKQPAKPAAKPAKNEQAGDGPKNVQPQSSRGKGKGNSPQPASAGWSLVTRKPKDEGEFQLRAQDWTAPLVDYHSLGGIIDKAKPGEVLKGVIFATKPQLDTASAMLKSSGKPYAMLHIYLDKGPNAKRIPGRVGDALRFRTAQVVQVNSAKEHLTPDPQGLQAPLKVKSLQTSLVYMRIPKAFASEQTWKDFKSNAAKACVQWAGSHHVQGVDAFGWMEEQIKTTKTTQLFGLLRVPSADVGTLLGRSGQKGIFVEPARRDTIDARLEWLPRLTKQETDDQYLQRALRGAPAHGMAVFGNRIAWRHAKTDGELLPRIWCISEVPRDWHSHEASQLLEQGFKDITILSHRLHKGTMTFRFRATCLAGDKDLVPLKAQVDDTGSPVVLWAALAPARTFQSAQRRLARGNVPHVLPDRSTSLAAVPDTAQASDETTKDANGKDLPAAKRTRGSAPVWCPLLWNAALVRPTATALFTR